MRCRRQTVRLFFLAGILVAGALYATALGAAECGGTTVFSENWEGGIGSWFADAGVWEVGVPTSGPGSAHQGTQCAATILAGTYPGGTNSRLISPAIVLPSSPQDGKLWIKFWHWFSIAAGDDNDSAWVEISTSGPLGPWQQVSNRFNNSGGGWTRYIGDLSAYAGQTVRIAFHMRDHSAGFDGNQLSTGWYVDELAIYDGAAPQWSPEGFENGIGCWSADRGVWQVGDPTSGPQSGYRSSQCAATILDGNYPGGSDSRLVSPVVTLPSAPADGQLWLRFWQWFAIAAGDDGDSAWVEISPSGSDLGPWVQISNNFRYYSTTTFTGWTQYLADLSPYAGQTVRIAFHLRDRSAGFDGNQIDSGWYVDDIDLVEGAFKWLSPESFDGLVGDDPAIGGWFADRGVWEVGRPTTGPGSAYQGSFCAATVLDGSYPGGADSRLISPAVTLTASPVDGKLWFSFWQWFSIALGDDGDSAWVEISPSGSAMGPWEKISNKFIYYSTTTVSGWTQYVADLAPYVGQTVRIALHFRDFSAGFDGNQTGSGWYVDNPSISEGRMTFANPEGFENGTRGWYADRGVWQIGEPTYGPGSAHTGTRCAATVLGANYPPGTDSRLVVPSVTLPPTPPVEMRFWHWYDIAAGDDGDSAWVEVSTSGHGGPWKRESGKFMNSSGAWTQYIVDLSAYAGQTVRVAFHLRDHSAGFDGNQIGPGWYVDDIRFVGLPEGMPNSPDFYFLDYDPVDPPTLNWNNPAGPFDYISVYASRVFNFDPDLGSRIALVNGTSFTDLLRFGTTHFYKISAVDSDNHESAPLGPTAVTGVENPVSGGGTLELYQNFPNPFRSSTAIHFILGQPGHVRAEVFNVAGRRVAVLADRKMEVGPQSLIFDGQGLGSGIYFLRVQLEATSRTVKIVHVQ